MKTVITLRCLQDKGNTGIRMSLKGDCVLQVNIFMISTHEAFKDDDL